MILFFFFNDTATPEIYPLPLHDALPISAGDHHTPACRERQEQLQARDVEGKRGHGEDRIGRRETRDRKSTRLNSSHLVISYAVFCLKKKKTHGTLVG